MKVVDFLQEFDPYCFPCTVGPWIGFDYHDPPFTKTVLRRMHRQGVIELDEEKQRYRLTQKAAEISEIGEGGDGA